MSRKELRDYLYRTDRKQLAKEQAARTGLVKVGVTELPEINVPEELKKTTWAYFAYHINRVARHKSLPCFVKGRDIALAIEVKKEKKSKFGFLQKINKWLGGQN